MIIAFIELLVGIIINLVGYLIKVPYRTIKIAVLFVYKVLAGVFSLFVYKKKEENEEKNPSRDI